MTGFVKDLMYTQSLRFPWLRVGYWVQSRSRGQVKHKVAVLRQNLSRFPISQQKSLLKDVMIGCFYIRDIRHGLGRRDVSRWMMLELERVFPGFLIMVLPYLHLFGYWKDFNLILQDIHQDKAYQDLENAIYQHLETRILSDIAAYNENRVHSISLLAKYIGKERGALDRQTGFARRFANQLYGTESTESNNQTSSDIHRINLKKYRFMIATLRPFAYRHFQEDPVLMDCEKLDSTQDIARVSIFNFKDVFTRLCKLSHHYKNLPTYFEMKSDPSWFGPYSSEEYTDSENDEDNNENETPPEISQRAMDRLKECSTSELPLETVETTLEPESNPEISDEFVVVESELFSSQEVNKESSSPPTSPKSSAESTPESSSSGWFSWFF